MGCLLFMSFLTTRVKEHIKEVLFEKQEMLRLVNKIRTEGCTCKGKYYLPVDSVVWNDELEKAAQLHSDNMFKNDFFNHKGSDGLMVWDRIKWINFYSATIGENIAKGQTSEQQVLDAWLTSPSHTAVIMDPLFTKMGVAIKGDYWTQVFAQ